jgi:uncharacterized protein
MTMRRLLLAALLFLAAGLPMMYAPAAAATPDEVPAHTGYVTDTAGVLGDWAPRIATSIADLERKTSFEIGVLTVDTLGGAPPADYAQRVYDRWKIGKKGKDNGLLFLVAVRDRKIWITTGYGTEKILPDGKVGEIRDAILRPAFKDGRYGEGLSQAVDAVRAIVLSAGQKGEDVATGQPRKGSLLHTPWIALGLLVLVFLVASLFGRGGRGPRGGGGGGGPYGGFPMGGGGFGGGSSGGGDSGGGDFGGGDSGGGGAGGDF